MAAVRLFNGINGAFYSLWGLWGVLKPRHNASLMGWDANTLLGLHEMRATWGAFMMLGIALIYLDWAHCWLTHRRQRRTALLHRTRG